MMVVLLVYRPEAAAGDGDPFDGIDVYGLVEDQDHADTVTQCETKPGWQWYIEEVK